MTIKASIILVLLFPYITVAFPDILFPRSLTSLETDNLVNYPYDAELSTFNRKNISTERERHETKNSDSRMVYNYFHFINNEFKNNKIFTLEGQHYENGFQKYPNSKLAFSLLKHSATLMGEKRSPTPMNKKVFLYGRDDRKKILNRLEYPYMNIVRISTGCTGTLLTPSYVLTAAHCVHDGIGFRDNMEMLKVEVPHRLGLRIHYIRKISVPKFWLRHNNKRDRRRSAFDYAVIQLNIAARGHYEFMPLHVPNSKIIYKKLYFLGFPYHSNSLWKSKCSRYSGRLLFHGNILMSQCDATVGNSGASVYTENPRNEGHIIGILSSTRTARISNLRRTSYSFITLLTKSKVLDICHIISSEGEDFDVCPRQYTSGSYQVSRSHRIVPFYG